MLRGVFLILYLATDREGLAALLRCGWDFALFNVGLVGVVGALAAVRHVANLRRAL